jgi:hypothetical protein
MRMCLSYIFLDQGTRILKRCSLCDLHTSCVPRRYRHSKRIIWKHKDEQRTVTEKEKKHMTKRKRKEGENRHLQNLIA